MWARRPWERFSCVSVHTHPRGSRVCHSGGAAGSHNFSLFYQDKDRPFPLGQNLGQRGGWTAETAREQSQCWRGGWGDPPDCCQGQTLGRSPSQGGHVATPLATQHTCRSSEPRLEAQTCTWRSAGKAHFRCLAQKHGRGRVCSNVN